MAPGDESTRVKLMNEIRRPSKPRRGLDNDFMATVKSGSVGIGCGQVPAQFENREKRCCWRSFRNEWRTPENCVGKSGMYCVVE